MTTHHPIQVSLKMKRLVEQCTCLLRSQMAILDNQFQVSDDNSSGNQDTSIKVNQFIGQCISDNRVLDESVY